MSNLEKAKALYAKANGISQERVEALYKGTTDIAINAPLALMECAMKSGVDAICRLLASGAITVAEKHEANEKSLTILRKVIPVKDDSGHWYVIPATLLKEFNKDVESEEMADNGEFDHKYGTYMTGGCLSRVELYSYFVKEEIPEEEALANFKISDTLNCRSCGKACENNEEFQDNYSNCNDCLEAIRAKQADNQPISVAEQLIAEQPFGELTKAEQEVLNCILFADHTLPLTSSGVRYQEHETAIKSLIEKGIIEQHRNSLLLRLTAHAYDLLNEAPVGSIKRVADAFDRLEQAIDNAENYSKLKAGLAPHLANEEDVDEAIANAHCKTCNAPISPREFINSAGYCDACVMGKTPTAF